MKFRVTKKYILLGIALLVLASAALYFFCFNKGLRVGGFPPDEMDDPDWLPSALVPHATLPVFIFSQLDDETEFRQIYLHQGDLESFDPSQSFRLTATRGDKAELTWGEDVRDTEGCTGPSFNYTVDDTPFVACLNEASLSEVPVLGFDRPLTEEEMRVEEEEIRIEGLEAGPPSPVPNIENASAFLAQKTDLDALYVGLWRCDQTLLMPVPAGTVAKKPIYWGGMTDRGTYLETIVEADVEGNHQLIYLKKELKECSQYIDNSRQYSESNWDKEVLLTCGGDNRNATLILPTRDHPDPALHAFKLDPARETAVSQIINLKKRVAQPCECGRDEDCDDGSPCTADSCDDAVCQYAAVSEPGCCNTNEDCADEVCVNHTCVAEEKKEEEKKTPASCESDGDCTKWAQTLCEVYYCDKTPPNPADWKCVKNTKQSVVCDTSDDTVCAKNTCIPATGLCEMTPIAADGTPCDADKEACTKNDHCEKGKCVAGMWDFADTDCQCKNDADCLKIEDGNACNGTLFCDQASNKCLVNPTTVVKCPSAFDTTCAQNACNPKTGACEMMPAIDGLACDDANACTVADSCQGGKCVSGKNNCECLADTDCAGKNQGNLCLGQYFCDKSKGLGFCALNPATVPDCSAENETACLKNACNPKTGKCEMVPKVDGLSCDADGTNCTPQDTCQGGKCVADVWDFNISWCECKNNADCAAKEDGNLCNGTLYCDVKATDIGSIASGYCKVNPATIITCPPSTDPKFINVCISQLGTCKLVPVSQ